MKSLQSRDAGELESDSPAQWVRPLTLNLSAQPAQSLRLLQSGELLRGATLVNIQHGAEIYQLRVTRQGKLLLTK